MTIDNIEKNNVIEKDNNSLKNISKVYFGKNDYDGSSKVTMNFEEKLEKQILQSLPPEAEITCAKFEGHKYCSLYKKP